MRTALTLLTSCALIGAPVAALANGLGENGSWQFQTTADKVNAAFLEDLRQKQASGFYAPPNITNNIARQFNCSLSASASGNLGTSSIATAGPSTTGVTSYAAANESQARVQAGDLPTGNMRVPFEAGRPGGPDGPMVPGESWGPGGTGITNQQSNTGQIQASAEGATSSVVGDTHNYQALNSAQTNSGTQDASVAGSTACTFAAVG